jgi:uncharacterized GH25 family protein
MPSINLPKILAAALVVASLPLTLVAHRQWMFPSATVISSDNGWVTIDAAVSNELFYFDHVPMRLTNLSIIAPDGSKAAAENANTGKYRSTFDVHLTKPGTYKIAQISNTVMASWKENGEVKNWRGSASDFAASLPAKAEDLQKSTMNSRVELFVTAGKPSTKALEPTGIGLELVPVTHPNDLVSGEAASFQFLMNGKPAAGLEVTVIAGGIRYRNQLGEQKYKTDGEGKFSATFKEPGMYWMNASNGPAMRGPGRMPAGNRSNYVATLEVLPQ